MSDHHSMIPEVLYRLFDDDGGGGGGLGVATPFAAYGDGAVDASGEPVFTLDVESPSGEVDGIICQVTPGSGGGNGVGRVDILQDGLYSVVVQGDLFGASLTGGSVALGVDLGPGMPGIGTKYNEGAVHPDDTEYAAVWSEIYPVKAGGFFTVGLDESGTATSRAAVLIVTKLS